MHPVIMFEIASNETARAKSFYTSLFGWKLTEIGGDYASIDFGTSAPLGGLIGPRPIPGDSPVKVIVQVDDLDATLARAEELGATRIVPPSVISPERSFALFADPDGNAVSIMKITPA